MKKTGLIFDLDGTLVDSMGSLSRVASKVLEKYYQLDSVQADKAYKNTSGLPFDYQLEKLFPHDSRNKEANLDFNRLKAITYEDNKFFPEVPQILRSLADLGYPLFVSSNNDHEIVLKKSKEIHVPFTLVLGKQDGFLKGPDHFNKITGLKKCNHYIFFGDSIHDARMANDQGFDFYARLGTFDRASFEGFTCLIGAGYDFGNLVSVIQNRESEIS